MTKLLYKGAVYSEVEEIPEWLYHITFLNNISSIQANGLRPGGRANWQVYDVTGKVFLTAAGGVQTWLHKLSYIARDKSDTEVEDGLVPIVLRVSESLLDDIAQDVEGTRDGSADAFYTTKPIDPDAFHIFDGTAWVDLDEVDEYALRDYAVENSEHETDGDEEYILLDEDMFLPPELL